VSGDCYQGDPLQGIKRFVKIASIPTWKKREVFYLAKWIYWYNVRRPHFGKGMSGKPPLERLKDLGYNLSEEFALLPPIILDNVSTFWAVRGGNNLSHFYYFSFRRF